MAQNITRSRPTLIAIGAFIILLILSLLMFVLTPKRSFVLRTEGKNITVSNSDLNKQYISFTAGMDQRLDGRALSFDITGEDLLQLGLVANLAIVPQIEWQDAQYNQGKTSPQTPIQNLAKRAQHFVLIPANNAALRAIRACQINPEDSVQLRGQRLDFQRAQLYGQDLKNLGAQDANYILVKSLRVNFDHSCYG